MRNSVSKPRALLIIAAFSYLTSGCSLHESVQAREARANDAPTVAVAKATIEDLSHGLVLTAEFRPYQEVDVMAKVAGFIKQINVDVGDRVQKGQLLATLEIPEMDDDLKRADAATVRAKAEVTRARDEERRAESAHDMAHLSFQRLSAVAEKKPGLVAQQEIDEAHSKDLVAEAQVAGAKSALAASQEQVNVNNADTQKVKTLMDYTRVTAPFAGVVTRRYADTGSMIQAGTASQTQAMPVVKLSENSKLRLICPCRNPPYPRCTSAERVAVRVPTMNRSFPGTVAPFRREGVARHADMDGHGGRRSQRKPSADSRNVRRSQSHVKRTQPRWRCWQSRRSTGRRTGQVMVAPNQRVEVRKIELGLKRRTQGRGAIGPQRRRHGGDRRPLQPAARRRGTSQGRDYVGSETDNRSS
jgi:biotin carboxyl carrier protein